MSVTLHWYKPPTERKALGTGSVRLKHAARFTESDGSLHASYVLTLSRDEGFLQGLEAADVEGAGQMLRDLIKYGALECEVF